MCPQKPVPLADARRPHKIRTDADHFAELRRKQEHREGVSPTPEVTGQPERIQAPPDRIRNSWADFSHLKVFGLRISLVHVFLNFN